MKHTSLHTNEEITRIYEQNVATVYRICLMHLKNIVEAEDATQWVFCKLIEYKKTLINDEHIKAWLILTARNHCKNLLKYWWFAKRKSGEHILENSYYEDNSYSDIWDKLFSLPPKYSIVIYLYYYEGYKTDDIAHILGENPSTIRTRLTQGRKKLKIIYGDDENE